MACEIEDYATELININEVGIAERCEVYSNHLFKIYERVYTVRMKSFGSVNQGRILLGINQLAYAFDKLLFDYVYIFLEEKNNAFSNMNKLVNK